MARVGTTGHGGHYRSARAVLVCGLAMARAVLTCGRESPPASPLPPSGASAHAEHDTPSVLAASSPAPPAKVQQLRFSFGSTSDPTALAVRHPHRKESLWRGSASVERATALACALGRPHALGCGRHRWRVLRAPCRCRAARAEGGPAHGEGSEGVRRISDTLPCSRLLSRDSVG